MQYPVKQLNRRLAIAIAVSLGTIFSGCNQPPPPPTASNSPEKLDITVSILPQKYFVERIGGENVNVNVMVEPGSSPATYEPKPQQLKLLSQAEAYMSIGVPFENAWMDRIEAANPKMQIVDTTEGIELLPMVAHHHHHEEGHHDEGHHDEGHHDEGHHDEGHHDEGHHDEGDVHHKEGVENFDPHIWVSPKLVKLQAQTIYEALVKLDPTRQPEYEASLQQFLADIDELDKEIRQTLAGVQNRKFMVFHPSWGYFANDYNLEMIPIEIGGQEPSAAELAELIAEAKEEGIQVIFVQPEFSTRDAETIANQIGGEVIAIGPLELNWLENLRNLSHAFAKVLSLESEIERLSFTQHEKGLLVMSVSGK